MIHIIYIMRLHDYIKQNKINVTEFAKKCGVQRNAIHKIMRGGRPRHDTLKKIVENTNGIVQPNDFYNLDLKTDALK